MVILVLSAIRGDKIPEFGFSGGDKVGHLIGYFGLSFVFCAEWAKHIRWSNKTGRWLIYIASVCVLYGVVIEVLQGFVFYMRSFDYADMAANTGGVLLGVLLFLTVFNLLKRYERFI